MRKFMVLVSLVCCTKSQAPETLAYSTEHEWIVHDVTTSVLALAHFAENAEAHPDPGVRAFQPRWRLREPWPKTITVEHADAGSMTLNFEGHIWEPAMYVPWAKHVLDEATPQRGDSVELHPALLDFSAEALASESQKLSAALTARPLDPVLHERAALLRALLPLLETKNHYLRDPRALLSRTTAHLAMAEALGGPTRQSLDGQLAELLLLGHAGHTAEVVRRVDALRKNPKLASWIRALEMLATNDPRKLPAQGATRLEQVVFFRALFDIGHKGFASGLHWYDQVQPTGVLWRRIIKSTHSVEICNRFTGPEPDLSQARRRLAAVGRPVPSDGAKLVEHLDERPAPGGVSTKIVPIDWGDFAQIEQRALLAEALRDAWCKEAATMERWKSDAMILGKLRWAPLIEHMVETPSPEGSLAAITTLLQREPTAANATLWGHLKKRKPAVPNLPQMARWFRPGTLFGFARYEHPRFYQCVGDVDPRTLEELVRLNPYDVDLIHHNQWNKDGEIHPPASLLKALGGLEEYSSTALYLLARGARKHEPDEYPKWADRLCEQSPIHCDDIAMWEIEDGRPDSAARYYWRFFEGSRDRVGVANNIDWLIEYELKKRNRKGALKLAEAAAATYSWAGLAHYGHVLETFGELEKAEAVFQKSSERYPNSGSLVAFYIRNQSKRKLKKRAAAAIGEVFPNGLEDVATIDRSKAPTDGVEVLSTRGKVREAGLLPGMNIVAHDGYRVRNRPQYEVVESIRSAYERTWLVWTGKGYKEIEATIPKRRLGIRIADVKTE